MLTIPPAFILDLHAICNQQCPYCVAQDPWDGSFGPLADKQGRKLVERFFTDHGPFNVILTGGEPMITPHVGSFLHFLVTAGHVVSLQTNLRTGVELFQQNVPPERTGWILTTLHSVAQAHSEAYAARIRRLRQAGYPVVAKLVLDQPTLARLEELYDLLADAGAGVLLSPLVIPATDPQGIPVMLYNPADWKRIVPRITLLSSWLFFAGGFKSRGKICQAGSQAFYGRLGNGSIGGCAHSFPPNMGNIMHNEFIPAPAPVTCELDRCCCDFNTYTGLVPGLDDREGFERLRNGMNIAVSPDGFTDWCLNAKVCLTLDLTGIRDTAVKNGLKA